MTRKRTSFFPKKRPAASRIRPSRHSFQDGESGVRRGGGEDSPSEKLCFFPTLTAVHPLFMSLMHEAYFLAFPRNAERTRGMAFFFRITATAASCALGRKALPGASERRGDIRCSHTVRQASFPGTPRTHGKRLPHGAPAPALRRKSRSHPHVFMKGGVQ